MAKKKIETVATSAFLVVRDNSEDWQKPQPSIVSVKKKHPKLANNEIAIKVTLNLPKTYFEERFAHATIDVPEDKIIPPDVSVESLMDQMDDEDE